MAKRLDLVVDDKLPEKVSVSWNDVITLASTDGGKYGKLIGWTLTIMLIGAIVLSFATLNFGILLVFFIALIPIGISIWIAFTKRNDVHFEKDFVRHGEAVFTTSNITRLDYGLRSSLTGVQPKENAPDPIIIRLWLNDSQAHEISRNLWDMEVNHQIHNALTNALEAVRSADKKEKNAEDFGVVGDNGMPDY